MTLIDTLYELEKNKSYITESCERFGEIWNHNYMYYKSKLKQTEDDKSYIIFADKETNLICGLERRDPKIWQSDTIGSPIVYPRHIYPDKLQRFLDQIIQLTKTELIYFPLVYVNFPIYSIFKNIAHIASWDRLSNPIICGKIRYDDVYNQFIMRCKTRDIEKIRERYKALYVAKIENLDSQIEALKRIELSSWKYQYGQDMLSRDMQFYYYSELIKNKVVYFHCVYDINTPVAYVIESIYKNVLYLIKWSYNEAYKKHSPGRNLFLDRLEANMKSPLKYVDMFGSPDSMKSFFETEQIERSDFCYPDSDLALGLKQERFTHDQKASEVYLSHKSIKYAYANKEN